DGLGAVVARRHARLVLDHAEDGPIGAFPQVEPRMARAGRDRFRHGVVGFHDGTSFRVVIGDHASDFQGHVISVCGKLAGMRMFAMLFAFAAAQALAQGQSATDAERRAVGDIVDCMVSGLPEDWKIAAMEINLEKPMDETGSVRYSMSREDDSPPSEPFQPC